MAFITKEKFLSNEWISAYLYLIIGSIIFAVSDILFVVPYKLAPGGVYGIATVLNTMFSWKISYCTFAMEIPLVILGTIILGPRFGIKTIVSISIILFTVWIMETYISPGYAKVIADPMLNTIVAGVFYGISIGFIFKSRATSGGSDIIAMILAKYTKLSLGKLVMIVDGIIVLFTLVQPSETGAIGWEFAIYSLIIIYIEGKIIDMVVSGANYHKTVMIVSDQYESISSKIKNDLMRGATIFTGTGAYSGEEKKMVYSVMSRRELEILKLHIREVDPNAFVNVTEANEILGEGFKSLKEE
ncbi:YitT family protein [Labilibaculum antarcticum]|uniref:Membrane protein n=1 Tax=Labilibaculum antarcticum TaxID=1717717 RepID=A0A1Y1CPA9_9BACT|nr:YitT family protein [Labilibaculum antarcticum]BAX82257.1 membrane protein [Labilibaculum antarcticum]